MFIYLAWVHGSALAYEIQQKLCPLPLCSGPRQTAFGRDAAIRTRVHQRLQGPGYEAVVDEEVFFDAEFRVAALEVAGAVVLDAMAEHQVLSASGRADRVGLNEGQFMQGAFQRSRREETLGDGEAAQVVESERHAELTEYRLLPRRGGLITITITITALQP